MQSFCKPLPAEQVLVKSLSELVVAVNDAYGRQSKLAFFILLFASIDAVASLQRPKNQPDTSGDLFKKWIDSYLLPDSGLACTSEELWGARCGILHTLTAGSRLSRHGKARQIHYVSADDPCLLPFLQAELDKAGSPVVVVDHHALLLAYIKAVGRFTNAIQTESDLKERALFHGKSLLFSESIKVSDLTPS
jgi:hypothetical protein